MRRVLFLTMFLAIFLSQVAYAENDEYRAGFLYLCCSKHTSRADNENHQGIGLSLTVPESDSIFGGATFGLIAFENSHNKDSVMLLVTKEFWDIADAVHIGLGAGVASGYEGDMAIPVAGWVQARYKWIVVTHIPLTVTTIGLHIPLTNF